MHWWFITLCLSVCYRNQSNHTNHTCCNKLEVNKSMVLNISSSAINDPGANTNIQPVYGDSQGPPNSCFKKCYHYYLVCLPCNANATWILPCLIYGIYVCFFLQNSALDFARTVEKILAIYTSKRAARPGHYLCKRNALPFCICKKLCKKMLKKYHSLYLTTLMNILC